MPVGGYLDVVFCFKLLFHQTMFISAWVHFICWQLGYFEAQGFALFGFLLNSCYGRMAGRIWEEEKQCFFTKVGKYISSVKKISVKMHLLPRKYTVREIRSQFSPTAVSPF